MQSKLPEVGTTIFTVMSQMANDCDAINLSQGFPSFEPDDDLLSLVEHHLRNGANQYAPMAGVPALRQAIADKILRTYGHNADPEHQVTVCTGATEGIFAAITATVRRGDEVIVFDPAYDSYDPAVTLAGGTTHHLPLLPESGRFTVDWQRLGDAINERTRLLIVNFPHNPTGALLSAEDLDRLADIVRERDCYIVSDEVYEHIVFDGAEFQSLLRHRELAERSFVISSFGKTCHTTGWKIGYCIAPKALSTEFRKIHQFTTFAVSTPMQHALADYMKHKPEFFQGLSKFYQDKRDCFAGAIATSGFTLMPAESTFFQVVDYSAVSDQPDTEFAKHLTRHPRVACIPVSVFYARPPVQSLVRFCFAKDDATLNEAGARLCRL